MSSAPAPRTDTEPLIRLDLPGGSVTLLGTAHVSRASAEKVRELVASGAFRAVAVELCASRHKAMFEPDGLAHMDLFAVLREGKAPMIMASLALGAYQRRLAEQLGVEPGAEMRAAVTQANARGLPVLLVDREIGVTLKRIYRRVPWWRRMSLLAGLLASVVSREQVTEAEIERLKEGDLLEASFAQMQEQAHELYVPLIEERDRYMAARLLQALDDGHAPLLAVVGAGHLRGLQACLSAQAGAGREALAHTLETLERTPPPSRWPRRLPWLLVALILAGFAYGFAHSPELGWRIVADWVLINGILAALGALLAAAHPLTVAAAFLAAPLTSLNPLIGAGMVTAALEAALRRPRVGDFERLRTDTARLRGWWSNRVSRILLVFGLTTAGSALGTYLAGFRILGRLIGA